MTDHPEPPFYTVWADSGAPSTVKHRHKSDAEREAERLALMSPGKKFYVLAPLVEIECHRPLTVRYFDSDAIPF